MNESRSHEIKKKIEESNKRKKDLTEIYLKQKEKDEKLVNLCFKPKAEGKNGTIRTRRNKKAKFDKFHQ